MLVVGAAADSIKGARASANPACDTCNPCADHLPCRRCHAEEAYSLPGLLPAAGRLANASVALLGPDYAFGSRPYLVCKSIINDMRALELAGGCMGHGARCRKYDACSVKLRGIARSEATRIAA